MSLGQGKGLVDAQKSNPLLPEILMCKPQFGTINFLIIAFGYVCVTDRCLGAEQPGDAVGVK